jgi:xanthine dehydrogenase YagS FAD-binding subunit
MTAVARPEFRAAGTDLSERRRSGVSQGEVIDLVATPESRGILWADNGAVRIGAATRVGVIAADARLSTAYPGLGAAAAGLATPQIRRLATLGGNLAQRSRCWYYRNPHIPCFKKGGAICPARAGNHLYGVVFDLGPCVAPHPSTLATALLAYEATINTNHRLGIGVETLLGDGADGTADHALGEGEIITSVELSPPLQGERALYKRATGRAQAEWPLVEVVARVVITAGSIAHLRLAAGAVAPVPIRLRHAEAAAQGAPGNARAIADCTAAATVNANPLPLTGYKLALLRGLVQDALERLLA